MADSGPVNATCRVTVMMDNKAAACGERSEPKEVVLTGVADSVHQPELFQTMQTVYGRLKTDKSNVRPRQRFHGGWASYPGGEEIKGAVAADICIAFITSGAAVAVINTIASVIARSKTTVLRVWRDGEVIGSIEGTGFTDSAHVKELAAEMIKSDVELRLHVSKRE